MSKENLSTISTEGMHVAGQELLALIEKVESDPENQRINPVDFIDYSTIIRGREINLFPRAEVVADIKRVEELQKTLTRKYEKGGEQVDQKENDARAALVESMLPQLIRELEWLGNRVRVINSSLYDDYFNKIDGAVQLLPDREIRDERDIRCVGFSMDFTLSLQEAHKKMFEQAVFLCQGRLPRMKYFRTNIDTSAGPRTIMLRDFKMPRIILACSGKVIDDSVDDFAAYEEGKDDPNIKERLNDCDLKYYFIRETLSQLNLFKELIGRFIAMETAEGNDPVLIEKYRRMLAIYSDASEQLTGITDSLGYDTDSIREKIKHIPSPTDKFDLGTKEGKQLLDIVRIMSKQEKRA